MTRRIVLAFCLSAALSTFGIAILGAARLEILVPVDLPPGEILATMTDAEICQLEHHSLSGLAALGHLGVTGFVGAFGLTWLVLFLAVLLGCFLFSLLAPAKRAAA